MAKNESIGDILGEYNSHLEDQRDAAKRLLEEREERLRALQSFLRERVKPALAKLGEEIGENGHFATVVEATPPVQHAKIALHLEISLQGRGRSPRSTLEFIRENDGVTKVNGNRAYFGHKVINDTVFSYEVQDEDFTEDAIRQYASQFVRAVVDRYSSRDNHE